MLSLFYLFVFVPASVVLEGLLFKLFWSWFVMTTFAAPYMSLSKAVGICALLMLVQATPATQPDKNVNKQLVDVMYRFAVKVIMLTLIAVIAKAFI